MFVTHVQLFRTMNIASEMDEQSLIRN